MWTEEQKQLAYAAYRFKRWTEEGNFTMREIDEQFERGERDEDFRNYLKNELSADFKRTPIKEKGPKR